MLRIGLQAPIRPPRKKLTERFYTDDGTPIVVVDSSVKNGHGGRRLVLAEQCAGHE
jgi:hypothetical protein